MKTMLVPIDFSDVTPAVLRTAAEWARAAGCTIHLFHVEPEETDLVGYESGMQLPPQTYRPEPTVENPFLTSACQQLRDEGFIITSRLVEGSPALEILEEAKRIGAEIIVMGSHRHGVLHHLFLGSVSGNVLKGAACPVLLVPTPRDAEPSSQPSTPTSETLVS